MAHDVITPVIGIAVPSCKALTNAEEIAPIANCMLPNKAEALPANFEKGFKAPAEVLGKVNPWQPKNINSKKIIPVKVIDPFTVIANINKPVSDWISRAVVAIR